MNVLELLNQWPWGAVDWLVIGLGVALAYIVFGIAGFGTALVAGPILILFMPLSKIVPLLVLLDFVAAFGNLLPSRRDVAKPELLRLLPCMAVGCTLGVIFLLNLKSDVLLLLMGLFISAYAIYSLWIKTRPAQLSAAWAMPMGTVGGMFGALFGSGGFFICDLFEQPPAQGGGPGDPECADQLQHGGALEPVCRRRCVRRATLVGIGAVFIAGHGIRAVDRPAVDHEVVPRGVCAAGDLVGAGQRNCIDWALFEYLTGFRQGLSCRPPWRHRGQARSHKDLR